ncbi:T9SS type A sorting domain-containing protein [Bacteroidia bacterium]|nr:T9SS type A sorting domain-containing protein [Bacteroidia bacterium]MDC1395156.1 T9SS type A sorting domain-containing protein [Bacteroidia bacterium]
MQSSAQVVTYPIGTNGTLGNFQLSNPEYKFQANSKNKFGNKDTLVLPFFDDFSESKLYPDSTKWLNNQVYVNNQFPIEPPTFNVATFDALDSDGKPYRNTINKDLSAAGDSLISQPVNLKDSMGIPYTLSDSIMLSFFYQPNGNGYHLNGEDSLRLYFKADNNAWILVWSAGGQALSKKFEHIIIPLKDANYLHADFQFMFTTFTRQVGNANHWHVDYVYLDNRRRSNVDYYNDYAVQSTPTSLLKNYASMPYAHFEVNAAANMQDAVYFKASNLYNIGKNIEVKLEAYYDGNQLTETEYPANSNNILAQSNALRNLPIYNISGLSGNNPIVINRVISIRENGIVNDYKANDVFVTNQVFHDYYAYDDGTAERGFGFDQNTSPSNIEGQVAYGFDIAKEDTLFAIATYFNEAVYDVSGRRFKYRIWKDLSGVNSATKDEMIYESEDEVPGYNIANGERTFSTHYLDTSLVLSPGKYYIGWWQQNMYNLNVGWDMNFGNDKDANRSNSNLYYKAFNDWRNTDLPNGTLMMRPHFGSQRELYASIHRLESKDTKPSVYPNPAVNIVKFGRDYESASIYNMNGEIVVHGEDTDSLSLINVRSGMYYVVLVSEQGKQFTSKLIILAH